MDILFTSLGVIAILFVVLGSGLWVFAGLAIVAFSSLVVFAGMPIERVGLILSRILFRAGNSWELSAIPLFIFMGELIFRSDISNRLFKGLEPWTRIIPGGILHTNVVGCALFAAVSGSSSATTATIGKITTSELKQRGYDRQLSIGSLAGAGSLGLLIPPSIVMIVYGIQAEVSISKLFMAGILPGFLIAFLYSGYLMICASIRPHLAPKETTCDITIYQSLGYLFPIFLLIVVVLGAIYSGIATPSEAAAVGVFATLLLLLIEKQLDKNVIVSSLIATIQSSTMVCSIMVSAAMLSTAMGYLHLPSELASWIAEKQFTPAMLLIALALFYIVLGLFLDGISITVMSLPITLPIVIQAGFDPLWFGVFLVIMVELGQITPPVGFNLFVLQGLTGEKIGQVAKASFPFFLLMCMAALIICIAPEIALWLPNLA
ncbi:TRAP transporter large permease [Vibrio mangrovi]|uniref:TRAP transporter large permease protein n=1 Tax=Vibrio mangrovi TaxID=474394 RepID=A0A1Y6IZ90_9VIBR|nr:TRAP transporter large permease subunit [Vibrio mangrovi]MDW6005322.1 TRAP transporter large permease subunit [Vibrio mangrovi]SMS02948.1 Sialic acid TRAP transporter permease protein SiaT [Vibrio mangrovi]